MTPAPLPLVVPAAATARLRLRRIDEGDAAALHDIFADPEAMRYWSRGPWTDRAEAQRLLERDAAALAARKALRVGVALAATDHLIGTVSLHALDEANRRAELGYALARTHWHRGYMHEALAAVLDHAFGAMALHRLEADIDPRNAASARSLERLGFAREGYLRERWWVAGEASDTVLYGLLRREWPAGRAAAAVPG